MSASRKFTDESLRQYLQMGFSHREIARLFKVSDMAISKRVAALNKKAAPMTPQVVTQAQASVWDTKTALQENYHRCLALLDSDDADKTRVLAEIRNHLKLAMEVMALLYSVQNTKDFMEEVMQILDDVQPGTREIILARLRERRSIQSAFLPVGNTRTG